MSLRLSPCSPGSSSLSPLAGWRQALELDGGYRGARDPLTAVQSVGQTHGSSPQQCRALSFCSAGDLSPQRGRVPELCPQVSRGGCVWPCLLSSFSSPPAGRALACATPLPPYTSSSSGCAALCRLPAGTWHGAVPPPGCSVPPALSPLLLALLHLPSPCRAWLPRAAAGDFSPSFCNLCERAAEDR